MSGQLDICSTCGKCGEEHFDGNWALCHSCAGPVFRAWYVGGALLEGERQGPTCGPLPEDATAIFTGLLGALAWRTA